MAFSQSLEFGNSTLLNLEIQEKCAIDQQTNGGGNCQKDGSEFEVIQESPSDKTTVGSNKTRRLLSNTRSNITHRTFRRSKSDSTLPKASKAVDTNYSEFFCNDFSYSWKENEEKLPADDFIRVSQVEAAFAEDFEKPIFSEDVNTLEDSWKDSTALMAVEEIESQKKEGDVPKLEGIDLLDSSSFLCPIQNSDEAQCINQDLQRSRRLIARMENQSPQRISVDNKNRIRNNSQNHFNANFNVSSETVLQEQGHPNNLKKLKSNHRDSNSAVSDVPGGITNNIESLKRISAWNLPHSVQRAYEKKGVTKMFNWQIECLSNPKVLFEHKNLVYSAPTSAGKSLVSEILLLKAVLERNKKVLFILPFISVVREKMFYLQDLLAESGFRVEGFCGGYTPPGGFDGIHVAICTIEKANSIVNKLLEQGKLDEIGTVIVDEVHLISDPGRGYILELLLAKILYMSRKFALEIQIVTMSATLANVELLKSWLNAECFVTTFRPVALQEMIKVGSRIYDSNMRFLRDMTQSINNKGNSLPNIPNDSDHVAQLCIETVLEGCSVIVFCPSKDWCENLALQIAGAIHSLGKSDCLLATRLREQIKRDAIDEVKKELSDIPTGLDNVLEKTITYGCAFHHAGLTTEERDIVEASFRSGVLKIIIATSTLSSGVNLPARRVIIRSPLFGGKQMSSLTYRQMIGRAGRTGKDTLGESMLICTENNARVGRELITADLKPITSCLEIDNSTHLKRALLEVISSGVAASKMDIEDFVNCTLLSTEKHLKEQEKENHNDDSSFINDAVQFLIEFEFVRLQRNEETHEENYVATRLGNACLASSMPPTDGLILFSELQKSRRCFVLESDLQAIYLVTPYSVCYQLQDLDWLFYLDLWEKLTPAMKKVGEIVGVKESFLVRSMRGQSKPDFKLLQIHKRFYTALALQELVNETPINVVSNKFKCPRGMLQSLQQMASTFAGIVTAFCNSLQWSTLALIVEQFKERLYFGVHRDLIDLVRLPDLNHKRARALFDAGITSPIELANSNVLTVEKALYNALCFDSEKQHENENTYETEKRNEARNFFITGKTNLTISDAAKWLIQEARKFVEYEIGVEQINWTKGQMNSKQTKEVEKSKNVKIGRKPELDEQFQEKDEMVSPPKIRKLDTNNSKKCVKLVMERNIEKENLNVNEAQVNFNNIKCPIDSKIEKYENDGKTKIELEKDKGNNCLKVNKGAPNTRSKELSSSEVTNEKSNVLPNTAAHISRANLKNENEKRVIKNKSSPPPLKSKVKSPGVIVKPRRSPRNHPASSTRFECRNYSVKSEFNHTNDINMVDEFFIEAESLKMSPGFTKMLATPEPMNVIQSDNNQNSSAYNKSNDEVPSSQQISEKSSSSPSSATPGKYSSRSLRSCRTPRSDFIRTTFTDREEITKAPESEPSVHTSGSFDVSAFAIENSLIKNAAHLNASHILSCSKTNENASSFDCIKIVDICGDGEVFKAAFKEIMNMQRFGFSLGLQEQANGRKPLIGANLLINQVGAANQTFDSPSCCVLDNGTYLAGCAFGLTENIVYYMNMQDDGSYQGLTADQKCKYLRMIFKTKEKTLLIFDAKEQLKILHKILPDLDEICVNLEDPKVANWLLQPDKTMTLHQMAQQFAPECTALLNLCGSGRGHNSFGLDVASAILPKVRSSIEACVTVHILNEQIENLERIGTGQLCKFFRELEMPLQASLAEMEVFGFPACELGLRKLLQQMMETMKKLESKIFEMHGTRFNLGSSAAVAKVLGLHRKANGRVSTTKQILEKIDSPISQLIMAYRKLNVTLTKNIQPLLKCVQNNRIYGQSITLTATGRISMSEPNLQNVAKDFDIEMPGGREKILISCRRVFFPMDEKRCLISADFCQLEMRILAHLSRDSALLKVMNTEKDIFTAIAANWNKIAEEKVSEQLRNGTKQICYGIVYGMGMRSLSEALKCTEQEATLVSQQFHAAYPGIRSYAEKVVRFARQNGYIETITGRRRYLEHINSSEPLLKNQAERQAVNSTIQGSAADIAKSAILRMNKNIEKYRRKLGIEVNSVRFVLHLHDELIFEVPEEKAKKVAKILSLTMENCVKLDVPLKVKLKIGQSWGELVEVKL